VARVEARSEGWKQKEGEGKRSCGPEDGGSMNKNETQEGKWKRRE